MQRLRVKGRCLFRAMTKIPSVAERAGAMTGKRHSKVTKMIRDIPHHSNKGAQTVGFMFNSFGVGRLIIMLQGKL